MKIKRLIDVCSSLVAGWKAEILSGCLGCMMVSCDIGVIVLVDGFGASVSRYTNQLV